jgi:hypothetical protein
MSEFIYTKKRTKQYNGPLNSDDHNARIEENYKDSDKAMVIQKSLSGDRDENQIGTGAGEALQNALREWGYAK